MSETTHIANGSVSIVRDNKASKWFIVDGDNRDAIGASAAAELAAQWVRDGVAFPRERKGGAHFIQTLTSLLTDTDATNPNEVKVGQVYADTDRRSDGRLVQVTEIAGDRATVNVITERGGLPPERPRVTNVRLDRFRPTSKGFRLIDA